MIKNGQVAVVAYRCRAVQCTSIFPLMNVYFMLCEFSVLFSSPEHMLRMSYCDLPPPVANRPSSVRCPASVHIFKWHLLLDHLPVSIQTLSEE